MALNFLEITAFVENERLAFDDREKFLEYFI